MDFNSFEDLEKFIENQIDLALTKNVAPKVKEVMEDSIQHTVYDAYPNPVVYDRRYELLDQRNMMDSVTNGVLTVENVAESNPKYGGGFKPLSQTIVTGKGYDYTSKHGKSGYEKPRPFYDDTADNLERTEAHLQALRKGLRAAGFDVR